MRLAPRLRRAAPALIAAVATACEASTEPAPGAEAGRYVAAAVAGRPLPALTDSSAQGFGVLLADTIELDGRGRVRRAFAVRRVSRAPDADVVYPTAYPDTYRLTGARLEIGGACNDTALCVANDTGTVTRAGIALVGFRYNRGEPVTFVRVAP